MRPFNCKTCGTQILVVGDREAELETERDALRARVARLEEALRDAAFRPGSIDTLRARARAVLADDGPPHAHEWRLLRQDMTTEGCTGCDVLRPRQDWVDAEARLARPAPPACTCGVIQGSRTSSQTHAPDCPAKNSPSK